MGSFETAPKTDCGGGKARRAYASILKSPFNFSLGVELLSEPELSKLAGLWGPLGHLTRGGR